MRRSWYMFLAALLGAVTVGSTTGCQSDYRGRVEANGEASAQAFRVENGVEVPVTAKYRVQGQGVATAQSVKPYLTLDGAWAPDVGSAKTVEADAVLIRPYPPGAGAPSRAMDCNGRPVLLVPLSSPPAASPSDISCTPGSGDTCTVPAAPAPVQAAGTGWSDDCLTPAVVAAPLRECGDPVYIGCDGTPGGNRPTPGPTYKTIEPGTGWPCAGAEPPPPGVLAVPPGVIIHVGACAFSFLKCLVSPLLPAPKP